MSIIEQPIRFGKADLLLTNQRAIFWQQQQALILSDLHLGKAAHFRKNGIPLPGQVSVQDLERLEQLILHYQPIQVIIVGDLLHAGANKEVKLLETFTAKFPQAHFVLVKGNHDRFPDYALEDMGIRTICDHLDIDAVHFSHDQPLANGLSITGHIHPGISLQFPDKKRLSLPCYVITSQQIILPAFSLFTGLDTGIIPADAAVYAFYEAGIFKMQ